MQLYETHTHTHYSNTQATEFNFDLQRKRIHLQILKTVVEHFSARTAGLTVTVQMLAPELPLSLTDAHTLLLICGPRWEIWCGFYWRSGNPLFPLPSDVFSWYFDSPIKEGADAVIFRWRSLSCTCCITLFRRHINDSLPYFCALLYFFNSFLHSSRHSLLIFNICHWFSLLLLCFPRCLCKLLNTLGFFSGLFPNVQRQARICELLQPAGISQRLCT